MNFQKTLLLSLLITAGLANAMIAPETTKKAAPSRTDLWEKFKFKNEGPLNTLGFIDKKYKGYYPGFEKHSIDKQGRILGWLTTPDQLPLGPGLPEAVFVAVTPHREGYSITFVDGYGYQLPDGLYLWRSQNAVTALSPEGPVHTSSTPEHNFTWKDKKGESWSTVRYAKGRIGKQALDPFKEMPSIVKAFGGQYRIYLRGQQPHSIKTPTIDLKKAEPLYKDMSEVQKEKVLSLYSKEDKRLLTEWLQGKLKKSGLSKKEIDSIIRQYLVELLTNRATLAAAYRVKPSLDIYDALADIEDLVTCDPERRKLFREHLKTESPERREAVTARALISCVGGVYQWD